MILGVRGQFIILCVKSAVSLRILKVTNMETKFNSQICTTREQSERLLSLGLKKETADMCIYRHVEFAFPCPDDEFIPAWSLHRLCILAATPLELDEMLGYIMSDYYDNVINHIESLIKRGYFPKEYLNHEN